MNPPAPAANLNLVRQRVAFAIMCFRFGISPQQPPDPNAKVPVDLSTNLARSIERQKLTTAALLFLQDRPFLPFTWQPTPHLDLFKDLTFKKYHALCFIQLHPIASPVAELAAPVQEVEAVASPELAAEAPASAAEIEASYERLLDAMSNTVDDAFSDQIVASFPLEG